MHGRLGAIRSMFIPGALHGIEAPQLAESSLLRLRSAILRVVWSCRQPLANAGAVLSMLDRPQGCDPACFVVWFRCRMIWRYQRLVEFITCLISQLLVACAAGIGFSGIRTFLDCLASSAFSIYCS